MDSNTVSIDMEAPSATVSTPGQHGLRSPSEATKPPATPYPLYHRDLVTSYKPVSTPYPLARRNPLARQQSLEPLQLQMRSQQEMVTSRPMSYPDISAARIYERPEPNYPTRPVFTVDPSFRTTGSSSDQSPAFRSIGSSAQSPGFRSTGSSHLPAYYSKTPPPRSTTSVCSCQCHCRGGGNTANTRKTSLESTALTDEETTSEDLSWRRLHMSRAKLKATATTSELLSGFAMVAMVELQINNPTNVPEWLFVMFSVCTTVLVAVHIFALMISTYLLPNIDAVSKLHVRGLVAESPHERMRGFIELAWAFSTVLGLFLFLVEVAILCWVKFWDYSFTAAWAATVIVIPVLIVFVAFAVHFYHNLVVYKVKSSVSDMKQLEELKLKLDNVTKLTSSPA